MQHALFGLLHPQFLLKMQSFGELLDFYAKRTGVSDTELSRTLGVSRQTIFRWREGKTSRPRYRDDVVKVADKLRLTPEETNTLLLAAGFPPDAVPDPPPEKVETTDIASDVQTPIQAVSARRWSWLFAVLGLALIGVTVALLLRPNTSAPEAAPAVAAPTNGEAVVAVALCEIAPGEVLQSQLVNALEREIRNNRIEAVSVVALRDEVAADTLDASYALTLYCDYSRRPATLRFGHPTLTSDTNAIDRYELLSPDVGFALTFGRDSLNAQSMAWVTLGQLAFNTQDFDTGFTYFANAIALLENPDADYRAELQAIQCAGRAVLQQPATAIDFCDAALDHMPDWSQLYLSRAVAHALIGDDAAAIQDIDLYRAANVAIDVDLNVLSGRSADLFTTEEIQALRDLFMATTG